MATAPVPAGLIDSDILIDAKNGVADAALFLTSVFAGAGGQVSLISAMELVAGCRNAQDLTDLQTFLQQFVMLPVSATASQRAYALMQSYYLSHGLQIADALIAATALESGLTLYTRNVRHFQMIPGLTVVKPY